MSFHISRLLRALAGDRRGTVAVMFALALLPMLMAIGAAVDYSMAANVRTHLQSATDAAAIQLCQAPTTATSAELQAQAEAYLSGFVSNFQASADPPIVSNNPRQVSLTTHATYNTAIMQIAGFDSVPLQVSATCIASDRKFEIALALDTTGSMQANGGGTTKIAALREAATDFVDYMFDEPSLQNKVKIALVPFAGGVAVNPTSYAGASWVDTAANSIYHWQNVKDTASPKKFSNRLAIFTKLKASKASWAWAGCFESLPYPLNVQISVPSAANPNSYYVPMFAPDEPGQGGEYYVDSGAGASSSQIYLNSYLDDETGKPGCGPAPADHLARESRVCKYENPKNPQNTEIISELPQRGPNFTCSSRPLTRLTATKSTLLSEITALQADGTTNIHEGFVWGWRAIAPDSVFADGAPTSETTVVRVIVLMTDGMNTWDPGKAYGYTNTWNYSAYSAYGYIKNSADGSNPNSRLPPAHANPDTEAKARAAMDELTRQACSNARNANIVIYTIGFSVASAPIDAQGLQLLADCAGKSNQAFVANDSESLIEAFDKIAKGIGDLRLSQ